MRNIMGDLFSGVVKVVVVWVVGLFVGTIMLKLFEAFAVATGLAHTEAFGTISFWFQSLSIGALVYFLMRWLK